MTRLLRHLPLLLLASLLLTGVAASCGSDEPSHPHHSSHGNDTPTDTTHHPNDTTPADTTHHQGTDSTSNDTTTASFSIAISAPRPYGYMGQTMQLTAVTSAPATVTWRSSRTDVAMVDGQGLVTFANAHQDGQTRIMATANGMSDSLTLTCRYWALAARTGTTWAMPDYHTVHPGDTVMLTIIDAALKPVNDEGFNAGACTWTLTSRDTDAARALTQLAAPAAGNGWQASYLVAGDTPAGALITVTATVGNAASALTLLVKR